MYVNVHVTVHDFEKLMDVFRSALVKEYHKETGILFENNVLKMKLYFEKTPPQETIYNFCECGNVTYLEYNYSCNEDHGNSKQEDSNKEEIKSEPMSDEKRESPIEGSDKGKSNDSPPNTPATSQSKKYTAKEKALNIPELEEIARTANSKSDFLTGIISFLEIPSDLQAAFLQIIEVYPELEKITWENILAALEKKEVSFNSYNRRVICDCVTKKLNLRFINVIASINRILSEHKGNSPAGVENTSNIEKEGEKKNSEEPVSGDEKQDAKMGEETPEKPVADGEKQDAEREGETPAEPASDDEKQDENEERKALFKCMPKFVESDHSLHVNAIEHMLEDLKSENSEEPLKTKVEKATIILASKCMPTALDEQKLIELVNFTSNAMETIDNESYTYLKPETVIDDKLAQNILRMQILTWTTIANSLAKYYDPNFAGRLTAAEFLSDLKEFLQ